MPSITELMRAKVITLPGKSTVSAAVTTMVSSEIGSIVVTDDYEQPLGIVTEKDLVRRVLAERRDPSKTRVSEIMSRPLVTVSEKTTVDKAAKLMLEKKVRHLVVTSDDGKQMLGMVSAGDIMKELGSLSWLLEAYY